MKLNKKEKCTCITFKKQGMKFTMIRDPRCPKHGDKSRE